MRTKTKVSNVSEIFVLTSSEDFVDLTLFRTHLVDGNNTVLLTCSKELEQAGKNHLRWSFHYAEATGLLDAD